MRLFTGTLAISLAAGLGAIALPGVSYAGVPATVTEAQPARVVGTTVDALGRPVVTVHEATDRAETAELLATVPNAQLDVPVRVAAAPTGSDPYRKQQWGLTKIKAPTAWATSTGAGVTVAVIDTGVDAAHPDLAGKVLAGYDVLNGKAGGTTDANGHGTHVAGIIGAVTGNGVGVSGVAPDAKILPVRVFGANGAGYMSDVVEGIVWATDHGANVINMSLGSTTKLSALSDAVAYARGKGVTVVAAAGNEREDGSPISYPAADTGVIAVAATDSADRYGSYSNAGSYVDVAAPGSNIVSTYPTALTGGEYAAMSGTSMAAPQVAAVAALLEAYQPALNPSQIEKILEASAVDLGAAGFDYNYGNGRVDAVAALTAAGQYVTSTVSTRTVGYGTRTTTTFTAMTGGKPLANATVSACLSVAGAAFTCTPVTTSSAGTYTFTRVANAHYRARLFVPSSVDFAAAAATASYTVKAKVTAVRSKKSVITVKVAGASGQTMTVQRYQNKKWKTVRTFRTTATRTITGLVSGASYRVVIAGTKTVAGVTSGTVKA
ncbi:type VII secretion-associated serine protease mycosin [Actinoplanes lutulentus]|uniref:Type VII secretion-associated serine protease mycosin n=1 Tax=Actinoplanes lutulentus TaxID=1287878 RepID=A0A327ZDF3_9ACTN|nr:S8 family serine peptidase [Actinoplanes lutulentus]MBB2942727.1 type VII secretion-associated serine protease mycosin [Actinoplanes lutulentus]RAK38308.1 type VII secretion-associated serine protease mycosin [Actinoplanes lutulentus]